MHKIKSPFFDLKCTLECGQAFRWKKDNDWYYRVIDNQLILIKQVDNYLIFNSNENCENILMNYFRFDDNLKKIYSEISKDRLMKCIIKKFHGLRLIRQEPFECLISYICSANNNIPNINRIIDNICKTFGNTVEFGLYKEFSFPKPRILANASLNQLKKCGLGFRAKYVKMVSKLITDRKLKLEELKNVEYYKAKQKITELPGVGNKIADCVLLFSFDRLEAFPVDVWIRRALTKNYFNNRKVSDDKIRDFAENYFGKYAGYANQYLFYYARNFKR